MNEGPLGVHEVELVVQPGPGLGDGGGVGQHADGPLHLRQIAAGNRRRRLVVDPHLDKFFALVKLWLILSGGHFFGQRLSLYIN